MEIVMSLSCECPKSIKHHSLIIIILNIYEYLSMFINVYQYLSMFINVYQYLSMFINALQYLSMFIKINNVYQCLS